MISTYDKNDLLGIVIVLLLLMLTGCAQQHGDEGHDGPMMNYHEIDERLASGGHFVGDGLTTVKEAGVKVVIDLRDEPPSGQEKKLAEVGIEWVNVPVIWKAPHPDDFAQFAKVMSVHRNDQVLVQCAANYRASAMTYLYRVVVDKVPERDAARDLHAVWEPNEQWREFMDGVIASAP